MDYGVLRNPPEPISGPSATGESVYLCPFPECDDRSGHMHINGQKGVYFCYKCSRGGTIVSLRRATGINWPLDVAARLYASGVGATIRDILSAAYKTVTGQQATQEGVDYVGLSSMVAPLPMTIPVNVARMAGIINDHLVTTVADRLVCGITHNDVGGNAVYWFPKSGWAPEIVRYLIEERGVSAGEARDWGLHITLDKNQYSGRVIVPSWCPITGYMRSFMARAIKPGIQPRYNSPEVKSLWPQTILSPLARDMASLNMLQYCVLVEGPFDAIALARTGYPVAALCGKHLSQQAVDEFKGWGLESAIVMLDAGETTTELSLASMLVSNSISVKMARMTGKKDPGASTVEENLAALKAATEPSMQDVLTAILDTK